MTNERRGLQSRDSETMRIAADVYNEMAEIGALAALLAENL